MLAAGAAILLVGLGVVQAGAAMVARHQAQVAADLGALAGARQWYLGAAAACARAGDLVRANHARLAGCAVAGPDLVVTTAVDPTGPAGRVGSARATARAGPVRGSPDTPDFTR
jgi:secretion/DNA translocation related TadE-like protein